MEDWPFACQSGSVAELPEYVDEWLTIDAVADQLGVSRGRVRRLIEDRNLLALSVKGQLVVPAAFLPEGKVLSSLRGTLIVLGDAGYSDREILHWLYTENPEIGTTPIAGLLEGRKASVRRVAQTLGF